MSYTVLARRYRSETFDDVVGQEAISTTLKNAISTDRVAHAYLFTGTRGVGKTTMARILAKALNCLKAEGPTTTPCNECESCQATGEGDDIDVIEIDAASNTGVEHIRQLRQNAIYRPARGRFKIYIIDEVHMLSVSAFNALLKTLEEPPEHVKFILATTEANKILPTILSRCQRFDFRNIQIDDIAKQIRHVLDGEKMDAEDTVIHRIARLANGSMRDALSLLDQLLSMTGGRISLDILNSLLGTPRLEIILDLADAIAGNQLGEVLSQIDQAISQGLTLERLTQSLQDHFRDLMILKNCGPKTELVEVDDPQLRERLIQQVEPFDDARLVYNITVLEELRRAIKTAGTARALVEATLVRMTAHERFSDTAQVIEQLQQLQSSHGSSLAAPTGTQKKTFSPVSSTANRTNKVAEEPAPAKVPEKSDFTVPQNLDLAWFQKNWRNLIDQFSSQNARTLSYNLKPALPVEWCNDTLTIEYQPQHKMIYNLISSSEKLEEVKGAISTLLSRTVKCQAILKQGSAASRNQQNQNRQAAGAKPSQDEIHNARTDPSVRKVIDILGGDIKDVRRLEKQS